MKSAEQAARAKILYGTTGVIGTALFVYFFWSLRELLMPTIVGALSAYLCRPLIEEAQRWKIPHKLAISVLLCLFIAGIGMAIGEVRAFISDETGIAILKVRGQYKINERWNGLKSSLPEWTAAEAKPFLDDINRFLELDEKERALFDSPEAPPEIARYAAYHAENLKILRRLEIEERKKPAGAKKPDASSHASFLAAAAHTLALWIIMPFVFLFLLFDKGQIAKNAVSFVPNRYFEVSLVVIHNVDKALGAYLRGVTLQCSLVGLTIAVCLWVCGIEAKTAFVIGVIAGIANAIPFLGPVIGFAAGGAYAVIAEEIHPLIPQITADNLLFGVAASVVIARILDDIYFQPIVLGKAVDLNPLLVIFGVMGGSILFGVAGMLLALPAIVIVKVVVSTLFKELEAYSLI